jgi:hypothetical protein
MSSKSVASAVRKAAKAEAASERTREQAEAEWRKAWWATTFALAEPTAKSDITVAYDEARKVLGQGRDYLTKRRRTGLAFRAVGRSELHPQMALEWARAHSGEVADDAVVADIEKADADGVGKREYAARFGRTFEAKSTPTPAEIVEAVRDNPDVVRALARHDDIREAIEEFGIEARVEKAKEIEANHDRKMKGIKDASARSAQSWEDDLALQELRQAASSLAEAIALKEEYGVTHPEKETELLDRIDRYRAAYSSGTLDDADREWLAAQGIGS